MATAKLTTKQKTFASEWVRTLNGKKSAIKAGWAAGSAEREAWRQLKNPKVAAMIVALQAEAAAKLEISREKVLAELAKLAFANMQDFTIVDKNGQPILDLSSITRDQFAAIQEIREDATGGAGDGERRKVLRTTVKLANKTQNLELLGKHLGLFPTKVDLGAVDPDGKPMAIRIEMVSASRG